MQTLRWSCVALSLLAGVGCSNPPPAGNDASGFDAVAASDTVTSPDSTPGRDGAMPSGDSAIVAPEGGFNADAALSDPNAESALSTGYDMLVSGSTNVALSSDGSIRYVRVLTGGVITHEELLDNGHVAVVWDHTTAQSLGHRDENLDGAWDWTITVSHDPNPDNEMTVIEHDPGALGMVQRRETYTRSGDMLHVVIELPDGMGGFMTDEEFDTTAYQPTVVSPPASSDPSPCSDPQATQVQMEAAAALNRGMNCLRDDLMNDARHSLMSSLTSGIQLRCESLPGTEAAEIDFAQTLFHGSLPGAITIKIDPTRYFGTSDLDARELYLWHEMVHLFTGVHSPTTVGETDPYGVTVEDPTYACASLCFDPGADRCQCSQCLGSTSQCDPRCIHFPACRHPDAAICNCSTNHRYYASMTDCAVNCPSGLTCFASDCTPVVDPCAGR